VATLVAIVHVACPVNTPSDAQTPAARTPFGEQGLDSGPDVFRSPTEIRRQLDVGGDGSISLSGI
jgi:hypothetical protein